MLDVLLAYHMARIYGANGYAAARAAAKIAESRSRGRDRKMLRLFIKATDIERAIILECLQ